MKEQQRTGINEWLDNEYIVGWKERLIVNDEWMIGWIQKLLDEIMNE